MPERHLKERLPTGSCGRVSCWLLTITLTTIACSPEISGAPLGKGASFVVEEQREHARLEREQQTKPPPKLKRTQPAVTQTETPPTEQPTQKGEASEPKKETADEEASSEVAEKGGDEAAPAPFIGKYRGSDSTTLRIDPMPERVDTDDKAIIRIDAGDSDTEIVIVIVDSKRGNDLCSVRAKVSGNSAEIQPGQPCFAEEGSPMTTEISRGDAALKDDHLVIELEASVELQLPEQTLRGSLKYRFEGQRE